MIAAALNFEHLSLEPYEPRGIFNSEMALVLGLCDRLGIEVVVESGRARGQSTYLLAKYLAWRGIAIHSIEYRKDEDALFGEKRLAGFDGVMLHYEDGRQAVPDIVKLFPNAKIAVLLDGPKGQPALDVLDGIRDRIAVGFIHDMRKVDHGAPAPFRLEAEKRGAWFTDDQDYVAATMHLDAPVWAIGSASNCTPYYIEGNYTGSYGPTLGVFL